MRWGCMVIVAGWLLAGAVHADAQEVMYKCRAPGRVTYSDRPCAGARQVGAAAPHHADKWKTPPQDRATYNCSCGYIFQADVTTSVGCPHCGCELAW